GGAGGSATLDRRHPIRRMALGPSGSAGALGRGGLALLPALPGGGGGGAARPARRPPRRGGLTLPPPACELPVRPPSRIVSRIPNATRRRRARRGFPTRWP